MPYLSHFSFPECFPVYFETNPLYKPFFTHKIFNFLKKVKKMDEKPKKIKRMSPGRGNVPTQPPVKLTKWHTRKMLKQGAEMAKHNRSAVRLTEPDYDYLGRAFEALVGSYDQESITHEKPKGQKTRRYSPRQMFENSTAYIRETIKAKQPLTITGMGLFMGLHRKQIFKVLHEQEISNVPEYSFIFDFADFIEMFNEYSAHKKQNPAGPIFVLKNFGWSDKLEISAGSTQGALSEEERQAAQKRISEFSE